MGNSLEEFVEVEYDTILRDDENLKAILFQFEDAEVWLPRSQIVDAYDEGHVTIPYWLAEKNGLI